MMFDIGFSEIMVIAVVALIVIGPERLPGVARTLGHLFGRMQRYVNDVKADIQREIEFDELKKLRKDMEDSARGIEESFAAHTSSVKEELRNIEHLATDTVESVSQSVEAAVEQSKPSESQHAGDLKPTSAPPKSA
jgi:sec-independent protein translocase protein TatB